MLPSAYSSLALCWALGLQQEMIYGPFAGHGVLKLSVQFICEGCVQQPITVRRGVTDGATGMLYIQQLQKTPLEMYCLG